MRGFLAAFVAAASIATVVCFAGNLVDGDGDGAYTVEEFADGFSDAAGDDNLLTVVEWMAWCGILMQNNQWGEQSCRMLWDGMAAG